MNIMRTYLSGEFAKKTNVTIRTLRYYDKIGLLVPKKNEDNGYRQYSDKDFVTLQKILAMKQIGFSLEEIQLLILDKNKDDLQLSLQFQKELIHKKIEYFSNLNTSIDAILKTFDGEVDWNKFITLVQQTHDDTIVQQYINANNLIVRIQLHEKYAVNKTGWFSWLFEQLNLKNANRILEVGCGDGSLWKHQQKNLRHYEIFLSDISKGMLESARNNLGNEYSYMNFSAQQIPFKFDYFDVVIANHVLFYMNDLTQALSEIQRVLKDGGLFYCSTYGKNHMKEIRELVKEFDSKIVLSNEPLYEVFGLQNGEAILKKYFKDVKLYQYEDALKVDCVQDIIEYILSCHGNQKELLSKRIEEFKVFVASKLKATGYFYITKECGVFECRK